VAAEVAACDAALSRGKAAVNEGDESHYDGQVARLFHTLRARWEESEADADKLLIVRVAEALADCYSMAEKELTEFSDLVAATLQARALLQEAPPQGLVEIVARLISMWDRALLTKSESAASDARETIHYRATWFAGLMISYQIPRNRPEALENWNSILERLLAEGHSRTLEQVSALHAELYAVSVTPEERAIVASLRMKRCLMSGQEPPRKSDRRVPNTPSTWDLEFQGSHFRGGAIDLDATKCQHVKIRFRDDGLQIAPGVQIRVRPSYPSSRIETDGDAGYVVAAVIRQCAVSDHLVSAETGVVLELDRQWVDETPGWQEWVRHQRRIGPSQ
jgi:hypothetical protein